MSVNALKDRQRKRVHMSLQHRRKTQVVVMFAMLMLGASVQAHAQQTFTVTGPVSWAGQFDYNT